VQVPPEITAKWQDIISFVIKDADRSKNLSVRVPDRLICRAMNGYWGITCLVTFRAPVVCSPCARPMFAPRPQEGLKRSSVARWCYLRAQGGYSRMRFYGLAFLLSSSEGRAVRRASDDSISNEPWGAFVCSLAFCSPRYLLPPVRWFDLLVKQHGQSIHSSQGFRKSLHWK